MISAEAMGHQTRSGNLARLTEKVWCMFTCLGNARRKSWGKSKGKAGTTVEMRAGKSDPGKREETNKLNGKERKSQTGKSERKR